MKRLTPKQLIELHELTPDREPLDIHEYFKSKKRKQIMKAVQEIEHGADDQDNTLATNECR